MMNILVVEESAALRRLIRQVVCAPPARCHECPDGEGALLAYARHRPDWVLLDLEMETAEGKSFAG